VNFSDRYLIDSFGEAITLGRTLGQKGGEGSCYEIINQPKKVAKIYHPGQLDVTKINKIKKQIEIQSSQFNRFAAWPTSLIYNAQTPIGMIMPKVTGHPIHLLYRPADRREYFPNLQWNHLVKVAQNLAAGFHALHEHHILMADINESNIFINPQGEVHFIDCDSYQFQDLQGVIHPCEVGVPLWTPPELQTVSYHQLIRKPQHDLFGLAALIFHLLFMGRHPFAGVPLYHQKISPIQISVSRFKTSGLLLASILIKFFFLLHTH
jgi:DNA-binding helix-hairpin-helix protein with protein kinase domain